MLREKSCRFAHRPASFHRFLITWLGKRVGAAALPLVYSLMLFGWFSDKYDGFG